MAAPKEPKKDDPTLKTRLPANCEVLARATHGYGQIEGYVSVDGSYKIGSYGGPITAAWSQEVGRHGGWKTVENVANTSTSKNPSVTHEMNPGHHFNYIGHGHSKTVDGNHDHWGGANHSDSVTLDHSVNVGNRKFAGAGNMSLGGAKGGKLEIAYQGPSARITSCDKVEVVTGSQYRSIEGDHVEQTIGNRLTLGGKDHGHYVDGNYDVKASSGSVQFRAGAGANVIAASDILIKSGTTITLQVGSSTIVISSSSITLNSPKIDLKSGGDITTQGSTTKIQGGGVHAPPTTFS